MPDRLTPEARSSQMRRIRKKDTKPERAVRRIAHALGYRFRLYRADLPGTPDLVFPGRRKVILVNGCFWHQHPGCKLARMPKSRHEYWIPKLQRNMARDAENVRKLEDLDWEVLVIWECEAADIPRLTTRIASFLGNAKQIRG